MFFLTVIAYISLIIFISVLILKLYEYSRIKKNKTKIKYNYFNKSDILNEKITYILHYKCNLTCVPFMIGDIVSHSDVLCVTDSGKIFLIINEAGIKNSLNVYNVKDHIMKKIFHFRGYTYKFRETIDVNNKITLIEFLKRMKKNANKFNYDITGYNCHMLFLDTLSDFDIDTKKKNICGFLPVLNQIVKDFTNINSYKLI